jgi:hypothetical protein
MKPDSMPVEFYLPPLSDEAAVAVHDVLNEILLLVESHYFAQIHRYYQNQLANNPDQSPPLRSASENDSAF